MEVARRAVNGRRAAPPIRSRPASSESYRHAFQFAARVGAKESFCSTTDPAPDDTTLERLLADALRPFKPPSASPAAAKALCLRLARATIPALEGTRRHRPRCAWYHARSFYRVPVTAPGTYIGLRRTEIALARRP
jgi:hypothetical protein